MSEMISRSVTFQPAVTKRASEIIFDQVRDMILRRELKPGDRLPSERNMMEMFQRSRPTIREALRMLERGGYIRIIAGSNGAVVMEPDSHSIQQSIEEALQIGQINLSEMSEYRLISEAATVTWACQRRTDKDLDALRAHLDKMAESVSDYSAYITMDPEYHGLIATAAKNTVSVLLNKTLGSINQNFMRTKILSMSEAEQLHMLRRVHEMHEEIFDAIKSQNAEAACAAMEKHLVAFGSDLK